MVAISGGIDSAVTLATLVRQGHSCVAVHMNLWRERQGTSDCTAVDDLISARQVANNLGVPFFVLNFEKQFKQVVVDDFLEKYAQGLTPNPCAICNRQIKFGRLLEKMKALGCDKLATGHYVRIQERDDQFELLNGVDEKKDQSYFLFHLTQEKLRHLVFPLGAQTKEETKKQALKLGLKKISERSESRGACFYKEKDDGPFLQRHLPKSIFQSGKIIATDGQEVGEHRGLPLYTIGQREGIGIGGLVTPYYVIGKDLQRNELIVGDDKDVWQEKMMIENVSWIAGSMLKFDIIENKIFVRIRYGGSLAEIDKEKIIIEKDFIEIKFEKKQRAITPGQVAVFYCQEGEDLVVLGGGWIRKEK